MCPIIHSLLGEPDIDKFELMWLSACFHLPDNLP